MKHCFVLFFALMGVFCAANATIYYSQGSVSPNNLSSWNSDRLGAGSAPTSFTNAGDQFVIQNTHVLYTSSTWTIGSASSVLKVETGGVLYAGHPILFSGNFQILSGGYYYHDNIGTVTATAGSSIFGGTESFSAGSNVEIRNWINNNTPLPALVSWGNLIINYNVSLGGNWNQQGTLTSIQSNLLIKKTGTAGQDFRLTSNTSFTLTIGGNLEIDQAVLFIKDGNAAGTSSIVQVNGDITVTEGVLNLGTADFKPNNELRFKGNLQVYGAGSISAQTEEPMLVANSNSVQALYIPSILNTGLKIAFGSMIKLNSPLTFGVLRPLIVAGTLNAGLNPITMGGGTLAVSGGKFSSSSKVDMKDGSCQVCQGNGTFSFMTNWCATTGDTGIINFSTDTILFNRSLASSLKIGNMNSKGKLFLSNQAIVAFSGPSTGPFPNRGSIELTGNGTLSFDETSFAIGEAFYNGSGGWLITGALSGLLTSGAGGNIQVNGSRNYNFSGINSYEFKSNLQQFTGNGFPSTVTGTLKVNNTNQGGLTLTGAVTIATSGTLHLAQGTIKTNTNILLAMSNNSTLIGGSALSYIDGPMRKAGNQDFTFHIGKQGRYSPVIVNANGGGLATDFYTVEYHPGDPKAFYGNVLSQLIEKISSVEYWYINGTENKLRQLRFPITPYSGVTDFSSLVIGYHDGGGWVNLGNLGTTGTTANGTIQVNAVNYGPFTLASTNFDTNPFTSFLPVNFVSFTARRNANQGLLNWEMSRDTDADYFEVLGSSDNRNFVPLAKISAQNNRFQYQFADNALKPGTNYYRIRVVEKSGNTLLSKIAALFYERKGLELTSVQPTIATSQTTLTIASSSAGAVQLNILDAQGRLVKQIRTNLLQGTNSIKVDLSGLSAGLYYINAVSSNGRTNSVRLLKQ